MRWEGYFRKSERYLPLELSIDVRASPTVAVGSIHVTDVLVAAAILISLTATALGARAAWKQASLRRLVPGAVVSIIGLLLLVVFYRWGFDQGNCAGRGDLVCLTNENQGVLTLLALLIAALAIWVEVLSKHAEDRRVEAQRRERANDLVATAIDECRHNLIHVALCYDDDDTMVKVPWGISIEAVCALGASDVRADVDSRVLASLDSLRRTHDRLQELRSDVQNSHSEEERRSARRRLLSEPHPFRGFVMHNIGFLLDSYAFYSGVETCRRALERPGLQDAPAAVQAGARRGARYYSFRTSDDETQRDGPSIRTDGLPVICWIDDMPVGVKTYALKPRFADAAKAHRH